MLIRNSQFLIPNWPPRFEQKIQATLARIWGEESPTAPEA